MEIVIGIGLLFFGWVYLKTKAKKHYINKVQVERELGNVIGEPYPSWFFNQNRIEEFSDLLKIGAKRKSIPEKFLRGLMENDFSRKKLLFTAGLMENKGSSFEEQILAVLEQVEKYWLNMDAYEKRTFINGV